VQRFLQSICAGAKFFSRGRAEQIVPVAQVFSRVPQKEFAVFR
jgi:hypothetical protein